MIFLSGVFFPVGNLPTWLSALVKINPATYGVHSIRQLMLEALLPPGTSPLLNLTIFNHTMSIGDDIAVVAGFGLLMMGLSMWSFSLQD